MSRRKKTYKKRSERKIVPRPEPFPVRKYATNPIRTVGSYIDYPVPIEQQCKWANCYDKAEQEGYCFAHFQQNRQF